MLVKHLFECLWYNLLNAQILRVDIMHFYQRLRDLREDTDQKQEDVAAILQITRQQYQLYESGKRELPLHLACILARYYNVSLDYLAGLTDTPKKLK